MPVLEEAALATVATVALAEESVFEQFWLPKAAVVAVAGDPVLEEVSLAEAAASLVGAPASLAPAASARTREAADKRHRTAGKHALLPL